MTLESLEFDIVNIRYGLPHAGMTGIHVRICQVPPHGLARFEGKLLFPIMYSVIIMMASLYGCKSALTIFITVCI